MAPTEPLKYVQGQKKEDARLPWIEVGYHVFATEGPGGLKVEVIAREVGKSKSSFYHHFADMEVFTYLLLDYHQTQARRLAALEKACASIDPELIAVLVDNRIDLLFSRQLRVHREVEIYRSCFEQSNAEVAEAFMELWAKELGLEGRMALARDFFFHALENFYLRITPEDLNEQWLRAYFAESKQLVAQFLRQ